MKNIIFLISALGTLFSCSRHTFDQNGTVRISLPTVQNESIADSILRTTTVVGYSTNSAAGENEDFNPIILPTFTAANYPINCYLVGVSSENAEAVFNTNFCGKRNAATNLISATYGFGPFVGLQPSGSSFEIEVPTGLRRKIYVFGLHALNASACTTLSAVKGQNPSKNNFSKPYLVGKSESFAIEAGKTITVPVNMNVPAAADYLDDCIFNSLNMNERALANIVDFERPSFPYELMVPEKNSLGSGFKCDFIDVVSRNESTNSAGIVESKYARPPAGLNFDVLLNGTTETSYRTKFDCLNSTNGSNTFSLGFENRQRRWIKLSYTFDGAPTNTYNISVLSSAASVAAKQARDIEMKSQNGNPASTPFSFQHTKIDINAPKKLIVNTCYPFFVVRKTLDEKLLTIGVGHNFSITHIPAGNILFYTSPSCTTVLSLASIPAALAFEELGIKAINSGVSQLTFTESTLTYSTLPSTFKIESGNFTGASNDVAGVYISGSSFMRKRGSDNCYPLTFRFRNAEGFDMSTSTAGDITALSSQFEGDTVGLQLFTDMSCTTAIPAIPVIIPNGSYFNKLYVRVDSGAADGLRVFRFKVFDGLKYHFPSFRFDIGPD